MPFLARFLWWHNQQTVWGLWSPSCIFYNLRAEIQGTGSRSEVTVSSTKSPSVASRPHDDSVIENYTVTVERLFISPFYTKTPWGKQLGDIFMQFFLQPSQIPGLLVVSIDSAKSPLFIHSSSASETDGKAILIVQHLLSNTCQRCIQWLACLWHG